MKWTAWKQNTNIAQAMIHPCLPLRRGTAITDKAEQLKKSERNK